jgi:hypothetical protein
LRKVAYLTAIWGIVSSAQYLQNKILGYQDGGLTDEIPGVEATVPG